MLDSFWRFHTNLGMEGHGKVEELEAYFKQGLMRNMGLIKAQDSEAVAEQP